MRSRNCSSRARRAGRGAQRPGRRRRRWSAVLEPRLVQQRAQAVLLLESALSHRRRELSPRGTGDRQLLPAPSTFGP